jgi:TusA-related sulfurtransferase
MAESTRTASAVLGELVRALAARDFDTLERCLHPEIRMRALTPRVVREAASADAAAAIFADWFGDATALRLDDVSVDDVCGRPRLRYRMSGVEQRGRAFVVEQTAYCAVADGRVAGMDLLCSGFRDQSAADDDDDDAAAASRVHDFDAGDLGCGSGLPGEVRRRLTAIAVGERLRVVTRDPSAREDLPALARLLGQRVLAVAAGDDGTTTIITLERTR